MSVSSKCVVCNKHLGFFVDPKEIVFCVGCDCDGKKEEYLLENPEVFVDENGLFWRQKL